ncbi:AraC family transcriptional regulator [Lentilactobacillus kefiri]|uniref:AraC family transcriptional regulator n=2 Tax=Lentilactobacillus kefiri TaxID=33962 RepID=A0A8E1RLR5_LENKE|nr:helix-turn-helix domain-containing protein [Lentilactobacillus kefiri]KRL70158.1 AraC family transcriptional regulator [Lentilactobacillus parakefiri DSM 10551]KRM54118.1 AraC family transcriptional regulator [Lentilactobacillus kefiri DSM 20587 = JCM 5818]MCJ2160966.1 helix-turn-helix domain-containing protein [Lentilactobacillus kefiri]MCP9368894.1 AraC family transcriptional regulator [Lentilactobacillus kefiri]MDH5108359.1 helix-turn-helix domain-containing protein [Lentilactobacillus k
MIIDLPLDGTLPTDIVCSHNRSRHHDSPFHQHTNHIELILFISGDVTFYTPHKAFPIKPGYLIAIPNGVWHRVVTKSSAPYERIFLNIKVDLINQLSTPKTDLFDCFKTQDNKDVNILNLNQDFIDDYIAFCDQLIPTLDKTEYGSDVRARILLSQILLIANEVHPVKDQPKNIMPPFLEKVTSFIDDNLAGDLSLSAFADEFFMNPNYLDRSFKKYTGLSIHRYVIEKRIELAKQLLREGHTVTMVCEASGFGIYSNFIRTFNTLVGLSPGKYKKKYQK